MRNVWDYIFKQGDGVKGVPRDRCELPVIQFGRKRYTFQYWWAGRCEGERERRKERKLKGRT